MDYFATLQMLFKYCIYRNIVFTRYYPNEKNYVIHKLIYKCSFVAKLYIFL